MRIFLRLCAALLAIASVAWTWSAVTMAPIGRLLSITFQLSLAASCFVAAVLCVLGARVLTIMVQQRNRLDEIVLLLKMERAPFPPLQQMIDIPIPGARYPQQISDKPSTGMIPCAIRRTHRSHASSRMTRVASDGGPLF